ncbi:ion channel [Pseudomonas profundi]|uniref:ion channel n=1 Tax=Pseudomonas profundi TaxID=1981513 RepID=UPI00168073E7|nr:ion channel [Pseudomonas profundi]
MEIALIVLAALIAGVTLWDQFVTVFSTGGAGPLSRLAFSGIWRLLLAIHKRKPIHAALKFAGPAMILLSIVSWYLLLGLAAFVLFIAYPGAVIDGTTSAPADHLETLYFTNTTISSLGYGDWVPSGPPWTFISTLATLAATIVLTVSLSYVLSVVSAAIQRRSLATTVFAMGSSEEEIIRTANLTDSQGSLKNYLLELSSTIDHQGLRHLAFPVLKYFHATQASLSPARGILLLADTVFLLSLDESGTYRGITKVLRSSIDNFVQFSRAGDSSEQSSESEKHRLNSVASKLGLDSGDDKFDAAFEEYLPRRRRLLALCEEDGWAVK